MRFNDPSTGPAARAVAVPSDRPRRVRRALAAAVAALGLTALPALAASPGLGVAPAGLWVAPGPDRAVAPGADRAHGAAVRPNAAAPDRPNAAAAQAASRAPVTATVGGRLLRWRTLPHSLVTATLRAGGAVKAEGAAESDDRGRVVLQLWGEASTPVIAAGDVLSFKAEPVDDVWQVTVPALAVDVDAAADRIVGRASPGQVVDVRLRPQPDAGVDYFGESIGTPGQRSGLPSGPAIARLVTAGGDGSWALDLAGDADVAPGDQLEVVAIDGGGDVFVTLGAATAAFVRAGSAYGLAHASLGTTVTIDVIAPDGRRRTTLQGVAAEAGDGSPTALAYFGPIDDGGEEEEPDGGAADGGGGGGDLDATPQPGDQLVLRRDGGLVATAAATVTLPALAVDALDRAGGVRGRAPAGAALRARLLGPFGERLEVPLQSRADDTFDARVDAALGPGWRAVLVWSDAAGVSCGVVGAMPQLRARIGARRLDGIGHPDRVVTATMRAAGDAPVGPYTTTAAPDGSFAIVLGDESVPAGPASPRLTPGSVVEVELEPGDPVVLAVPDVTTSTDPDRERVTGVAPPGAELVVTLHRPETIGDSGEVYGYTLADHRPVRAGLDGAFAIDFGVAAPSGPAVDLEPPMWGEAVLVRPDGHFVTRAWAPVAIEAWLDSPWLNGHGPPGEAVAITVRDAAGNVVVQHTEANAEPWTVDSPDWWTDLTDRFGQTVPLEAGDEIEVAIAGQRERVVVPVLEAASHVADDRVTGRTAPGAPVELTVFLPEGDDVSLESRAAADGRFDFDLAAAGADLVYNAFVSLATQVGRHRFGNEVNVPGLTVDLDAGEVAGSAEPDVVATLSVERAGREVGRRTVPTGPYAWFNTAIPGADGAPLALRPGDVIVLSTPGARFIEPRVTMVVPELTVDLATTRDAVTGRFDPRGALVVNLWANREERVWPGQTRLATEPDGRWALGWDNADFRLTGGWTAWAQWTSPSGHKATRLRTVPQLDLRLDSPQACGQALPARPVRLALRGAAGDAVAAATAGPDGRFAAGFAAANGQPRAVRPGDRIAADLGGWADDIVVPPLAFAVDWATGRISGTTAASTTVGLATWSGDCTADGGGLGWTPWSTQSGADGRFGLPLPSPESGLFEDGRFALVVDAALGHRVYQPLGTVRITAWAETAALTGTGWPGQPLTATLHAAGGALRATAAGAVGDDGRWALSFADGGGRPAVLRDGDIVRVGAGGSHGQLTVEPLAFDFDVARGVRGTARPGRLVGVELDVVARRLPGGDTVSYALEADAQGRFVLDAPPPRARWSFADVRAVRASIALTGGHALRSELALAAPTTAVYLPIGHRR